MLARLSALITEAFADARDRAIATPMARSVSSLCHVAGPPAILRVTWEVGLFFLRLVKKKRYSPCWWEKPLVVALKHSEGIKHKVLLQKHKLTIN